MNIQNAREQLMAAVTAYGLRAPDGSLRVPLASQRPVYLIGPPGVGKTAIVAQVARAMNVGFAAYTMTHHTRQTAIGLPSIVRRTVAGEERLVTEYTMSEIVASVWAKADAGAARGILFLDEINCVSESLMPAVLQLLQYKSFGAHALPEGWMIVCAGNPPRWNRYAHTFDAVVTDRLRVIEVDADLAAWQAYAAERGVHPCVRAYLNLRPEDFCLGDGDRVVSPRSWTDLSDVMRALEAAGLDVDAMLFSQYLQLPDVAERFALFYRMHAALRAQLEAALSGETPPSLNGARFDEMLFAAMLLSDRLGGIADEARMARRRADETADFVTHVRTSTDGMPAAEACEREIARRQDIAAILIKHGASDPEEAARREANLSALKQLAAAIAPSTPKAAALSTLEAGMAAAARTAAAAEVRADAALTRALDFIEAGVDDPNVRLIVLNDLTRRPSLRPFVRNHQPRIAALQTANHPETRARALLEGD